MSRVIIQIFVKIIYLPFTRQKRDVNCYFPSFLDMKTDFFLTQYDSFIHSLTLFILGDDEVFPPFEAVDDVFISENPRF